MQEDKIGEIDKTEYDATLIDGGLLLHTVFGKIGKISSCGAAAKTVLSHIRRAHQTKQIQVLFDKYRLNSLKVSTSEKLILSSC